MQIYSKSYEHARYTFSKMALVQVGLWRFLYF